MTLVNSSEISIENSDKLKNNNKKLSCWKSFQKQFTAGWKSKVFLVLYLKSTNIWSTKSLCKVNLSAKIRLFIGKIDVRNIKPGKTKLLILH